MRCCGMRSSSLLNAFVTRDGAAAVTGEEIDACSVSTIKLADGAVTSAKIGADAEGANQLQEAIPIDMQEAVLSSAELRDYAETSPTATISAGVLTLDLAAGSVFEVTLTADVTSLVLANPPAPGRAGSCILLVREHATGGRSLAWPASVQWPGGEAPAVTFNPNALDVYCLVTREGGATWFGFLGARDFS